MSEVVGDDKDILDMGGGGLLSSMVDSTLAKFTWTSSNGAWAQIGQRGTLDIAPSKAQHHWQPLTRVQQSLTIIGHQKHSCTRPSVRCYP